MKKGEQKTENVGIFGVASGGAPGKRKAESDRGIRHTGHIKRHCRNAKSRASIRELA
jgi:hypothetical protein